MPAAQIHQQTAICRQVRVGQCVWDFCLEPGPSGPLSALVLILIFEAGSFYVAQADLQCVETLLSHLPKCWGYRVCATTACSVFIC